jgi:hypothetical protein
MLALGFVRPVVCSFVLSPFYYKIHTINNNLLQNSILKIAKYQYTHHHIHVNIKYIYNLIFLLLYKSNIVINSVTLLYYQMPPHFKCLI